MLLFFFGLFLLFCFWFLRFGKFQISFENYEKDCLRKKKRDRTTIKIAFFLTEEHKIFELHIKKRGKISHRKMWIPIKRFARKKGWTKKWKKEVKELSKEEQKEILEYLWKEKNIQLKIRKLNVFFRVGLEDVILTSYAVSIFSILTSILLSYIGKEKWRKDYHYVFYPSYQEKLNYHLRLNITVQMSIWKMIKIIWWIYRWKKRKKKIQNVVVVPSSLESS